MTFCRLSIASESDDESDDVDSGAFATTLWLEAIQRTINNYFSSKKWWILNVIEWKMIVLIEIMSVSIFIIIILLLWIETVFTVCY